MSLFGIPWESMRQFSDYTQPKSPVGKRYVHQATCSACWRVVHPDRWPPPWKHPAVTMICHLCGNETESGISVQTLVDDE